MSLFSLASNDFLGHVIDEFKCFGIGYHAITGYPLKKEKEELSFIVFPLSFPFYAQSGRLLECQSLAVIEFVYLF